jgi:hypothetical protein
MWYIYIGESMILSAAARDAANSITSGATTSENNSNKSNNMNNADSTNSAGNENDKTNEKNTDGNKIYYFNFIELYYIHSCHNLFTNT